MKGVAHTTPVLHSITILATDRNASIFVPLAWPAWTV